MLTLEGRHYIVRISRPDTIVPSGEFQPFGAEIKTSKSNLLHAASPRKSFSCRRMNTSPLGIYISETKQTFLV